MPPLPRATKIGSAILVLSIGGWPEPPHGCHYSPQLKPSPPSPSLRGAVVPSSSEHRTSAILPTPMTALETVLKELATKPDMVQDSALGPLAYRTVLAPPSPHAPPTKILGIPVPEPMRELWRHTSELRIADEPVYGQWGLVMVSPEECESQTLDYRKYRDRDAKPDDLIVGYFRGDSELVLLPRGTANRPDEVHIALPIDRRADWPVAAPSLAEFLSRFAESGEKWWFG